MRAVLTRLALVTAAFWAAVALYIVFTLPARSLALDGGVPDTVAFGAYHVHSSRSDGAGDRDRIAYAAASQELAFVVLTDHGDATRPPEPPAYVEGVLLIDGVEINTSGGHLVALGLTAPSPYPLAGRPADVIDDVHRQGGFAIAAHPDSPEPGLRWSGRGGRGGGGGGGGRGAAIDGLEWFNADTQWRDETPLALVGAAARSLFRGPESIATLFVRPADSLTRWDQMLQSRQVVGLAAVDAHGGITSDGPDGEGSRTLLPLPTYAATLGTVVQGVVLDTALSGDPGRDAAAILSALTTGATFSLARAVSGPAHLEFTAETFGTRASMGGQVPFIPGAAVTFSLRVPQAPGVRIDLLRDGRTVATGRGSLVFESQEGPGAFRPEVMFPGTDLPWIIGNPIRVGGVDAPEPVVLPEPLRYDRVPLDDRWVIEREPRSAGAVTREGETLVFDYTLADGEPSGQYAALVAPVGGGVGYDRVQFTVSAERPMRVSFQLRLPGSRDGLRWRQSVYVDQDPRVVVVRLEDLEPVGGQTSQRPLVARIEALLFVVDTVNTLPDSSGTIHLRDVMLGVGDISGG